MLASVMKLHFSQYPDALVVRKYSLMSAKTSNCHQHGLKCLFLGLLPLKGHEECSSLEHKCGELSLSGPWISLVHLSPLDSVMCEVTQWRHRSWSCPPAHTDVKYKNVEEELQFKFRNYCFCVLFKYDKME